MRRLHRPAADALINPGCMLRHGLDGTGGKQNRFKVLIAENGGEDFVL